MRKFFRVAAARLASRIPVAGPGGPRPVPRRAPSGQNALVHLSIPQTATLRGRL